MSHPNLALACGLLMVWSGVSLADEAGQIAQLLSEDAEQVDEVQGADQVTDPPPAKTPFFDRDGPQHYQLVLQSGRKIDIGEIFSLQGREIIKSFHNKKQMAKSPLVRVNYQESDQPLLLASRRGKVLNGPFASFTEQGAPVALVSYSKGKRNSTLLTWDEDRRPLVFAQYADGQLDGVRCLFRGCCTECQKGHIWLVQEWHQGKLLAEHVVQDDDSVTSVEYRGGQQLGPTSPELELAGSELGKFEDRFDRDEGQLKEFMKRHYQLEQNAIYERLRLQAANRRYQFMSAVRSARFPTRGGVLAKPG